ncbi:MAG: TIGR00159 family protein [Bacteroidetes bacterium]|nr:MAG: TIGR00159 family protein [Bacteroidota bacterium]TAG85293.1 MAG: TIGR00159 family protein [Bacteroidota bacterium]
MILGLQIGLIEIGWLSVLDILLVAILLYQLYLIIKGNMALKIIWGAGAIFGIWLIVTALEMELLSKILGQFMGVGVIGALVLFQAEVRKFLLLIGKAEYFKDNWFLRLFFKKEKNLEVDLDIFIDVCFEMGTSGVGALIVFNRNSDLSQYKEVGDLIDAVASKRLITSIFNKYSPLHDGAMLINKNGRIDAVRCILPISDDPTLPAEFGLRHKSAIGVTEITDAMVLVVSEETGHVSLVVYAKVMRGLTKREMKKKMIFFLTNQDEKDENQIKIDENEQ